MIKTTILVWSENGIVKATFKRKDSVRDSTIWLGKVIEDKVSINHQINFWKQNDYEVIIGKPKES